MTIEVIICTCETDVFSQIMTSEPAQCIDRVALTDIAVYIEFDITTVGPYDGRDRIREALEKEPKA